MKYTSLEKESASIKACTYAAVAALIIGMVGSGPVNAETGTSAGNTSREKNTGSDRGAKGYPKETDRTVGGSPKGTEKSLGSSRSEDPTGRAPAGTHNAPGGGSGGDKTFTNVGGKGGR